MKIDWIDLSLDLEQGIPVYPGDPAYSRRRFLTHEHDGLQASALSMSCHTGTHLDAPRHFLEDGATIDQLPIDRLIGPAFVADTAWIPGRLLDLSELDLKGRQDGDMLILATGWDSRAGSERYYQDIPCFAPGSSQWLIQKGIRVLGLDLPTVVEVSEPANPAMMHRQLLGNEIIIIESLARLKPLVGQRVWMHAVPLRLVGSDGSPVRAYASHCIFSADGI
jgi:kynurenine formamidase